MKRNKIWKRMMVSLVGVTALVGLSACGSNEAASEGQGENGPVQISLYSGGSLNVKNYWEKVIPMFEDEHPGIDVELVFTDSGTGGQSALDRAIAAKKAGKDSEIDILEGGSADIFRGKEEGIFLPLEQENIQNLERVAPENLEATEYLGLPYRASSVILAYNSEKVKNPPNSPEELYQWIKENPGRFAYNDPSTGGSGDSFVLTAIYNRLPDDAMNSTDPSIMDEWDEGFQLLKDLHPYLYKEGVYPKKNQGTLDLLANGEVDMIPAWSDMALEQVNKGLLPETTKLKQLSPPFTGGPTNLMLVDNGNEERKIAAETFLNFVLTTEAQEVVVNEMYGYPGIMWEYLPEEMQANFESVSGGYRTFNGGAELQAEMWKRWQREVATQ